MEDIAPEDLDDILDAALEEFEVYDSYNLNNLNFELFGHLCSFYIFFLCVKEEEQRKISAESMGAAGLKGGAGQTADQLLKVIINISLFNFQLN